MSVNKYKPHLYIIPEDDADRQIADGFVLHPRVAASQVQVVGPAGGWVRVLEIFLKEYIPLLRQNNNTYVALLIDYDGQPAERRGRFRDAIPEDLRARVFVVGPLDNPEALRQALGKSYEEIGGSLADDCDGDTADVWEHEQLHHNNDDRIQMITSVKPFLFS